MAPQNGTSKPRNGVAGRPLASRPVPAIPLTFTPRRPVPAPTKPSPASHPITNGSALKNQPLADSPQDLPNPIEPQVVKSEGNAAEVKVAPATNGEGKPDISVARPTSADSENAKSFLSGTAPEPVIHNQQENTVPDKPTTELPALEKAAEHGTPAPPPATVRLPPIVSPPRNQMPPTFHPASRPPNLLTNGDVGRVPRPVLNGPPRMHHPHPSNGSLQFGGFGSNSSSPAPPHSGGIAPPPGMPHDGRRPFYGHNGAGNGFPPQMPYGTEFVPVTGLDAYGRPVPAHNGMDAYTPYVATYGPSTPHSFQGSHSSAQAEENGAYSQHPVATGQNGSAAQDDHRTQQHPTRGFGGPPPQRMMHAAMLPPHLVHHMADGQGSDGLTGYMQSQFRDTAFADCTLELRYLDGRAPVVRIPGHRLILARSQPIRSILESASGVSDSGPYGQAMRSIGLASDDKYLRSDAFWMAVQRLYAFPLLAIPEPDGGLTLAGSSSDRFDFALGYAASGHLLGWSSVVVRGIEIATHLLSWFTLEKALEFALGDQTGRGSADRHTQFTYGEPVQILMNGIISFIINSFPANFSLDANVDSPQKYARLPAVPVASPLMKSNGPPIARGTCVHLGPGRRLRPTHIKFGDMSPSAGATDGANAIPEAAILTPQQRMVHATLSRVLLNLPFAFLKPALESSGYGNVSGWANTEARHQVMRDVVAERESRRFRAVEAIEAGLVPDSETIRRALQSVEPRQNDEWHILGWQEEVLSYGMADTPSLSRTWVPLKATGHEFQQSVDTPAAAYP